MTSESSYTGLLLGMAFGAALGVFFDRSVIGIAPGAAIGYLYDTGHFKSKKPASRATPRLRVQVRMTFRASRLTMFSPPLVRSFGRKLLSAMMEVPHNSQCLTPHSRGMMPSHASRNMAW